MYLYIYIYIHRHTYIHIDVDAFAHVYVHVHTCVLLIYIYIYICRCTYVFRYVCLYIHMFVDFCSFHLGSAARRAPLEPRRGRRVALASEPSLTQGETLINTYRYGFFRDDIGSLFKSY